MEGGGSPLQEQIVSYNTLPWPNNGNFFGRDHALQEIADRLSPCHEGISSVSLHGLGGVGKTQLALEYCYRHKSEYDAIFWANAESELSIQQSLANVAVDALRLENAHPQTPEQNRAAVLHWLETTSLRWLLVFDDVQDASVLSQQWPLSGCGSIIITTRSPLYSIMLPSSGLEVTPFTEDEGARFLLHILRMSHYSESELRTAHEISAELGGLPLALYTAAGYSAKRNFSLAEFWTAYKQYSERILFSGRHGTQPANTRSLDAVWELTFAQLTTEASALMGAISFLDPDSIPMDLFWLRCPDLLPNDLAFCKDELKYAYTQHDWIHLLMAVYCSLADTLESLLHLALIQKDFRDNAIRIHRLVQHAFRARMKNRQEHFEAAIALLLDKQPGPDESNGWSDYDRLLPHWRRLQRHWKESQTTRSPLKSNMYFVH